MTDRSDIRFGEAEAADLSAIVAMLADDFLGSGRESASNTDHAAYEAAFARIQASPDNAVYVARQGERVVGTFQLTFIPGLSFTGGTRAQIESVRVDASCRGMGIGEKMIRFGIGLAREKGCCMVQLAMNKQRTETLRFYERLGFVASHEGFKMML